MAKKIKKASSGKLGRAILQYILIVFSVLLALFFDHIREQQKTRAELKSVYQGLRGEMELNRKALLTSMQYHEAALGRIDSLLSRAGTLTTSTIWQKLYNEVLPSGPDPAKVQSDAWNIFTASGLAGEIRFIDARALSSLYAIQGNDLNNANLEIRRFITQAVIFDRHDNQANLMILRELLNEVCRQEKRLLEATQKALDDGNNWQYLEG